MKHLKRKKIIMLFLVGMLIVVFCFWQNNDIVVSNYSFKTKKISNNLDGYKIAQISDLHNKKFGKNQMNLINILKKENPNCIAITGDIVDSKYTDIDVALEFVKIAVKIAPVYYITGNHEYLLDQNDWNRLMQTMEQYGVKILDNEAINIEGELVDDFYLIGLSDKNLSDDSLKSLTSNLHSEKLQIVLAHEPQFLNIYSDSNVDLVLSGHAHGGQFRFPLIGGLIAPGQGFFPKYTSGEYKKKNTTMIVNRGLGNSVIPVRVFNRPEVVIVKLQKQ
ncbi:MAG: metallophosphoesterase [Bacillales bacterium]|jgi:predicted MPP superfamily phosphohydrolase|nr:metallophosphoesterase [Bacillales bacterium]